jgi:hypothetical protein
MITITDTIPVAFIMGGGVSLCVSGFSKNGLPLSTYKRITGRPAKVIGVVSLILSLVAAGAWIILKGAAG